MRFPGRSYCHICKDILAGNMPAKKQKKRVKKQNNSSFRRWRSNGRNSVPAGVFGPSLKETDDRVPRRRATPLPRQGNHLQVGNMFCTVASESGRTERKTTSAGREALYATADAVFSSDRLHVFCVHTGTYSRVQGIYTRIICN